MITRRRNQPHIQSLGLLAQFLNHCAQQEQITQAQIAERISSVSVATVSRWFRDSLVPTKSDLKSIAQVINIPFETLLAVQMLQSIGKNTPVLGSSGVWYFMTQGHAKNLLLSGITMLGGTMYLRSASLAKKELLLLTLNPLSKSAEQFESKYDGWKSGSIALSWLTSLAIIRANIAKNPSGHVRLWIHDSIELDPKRHVGEIAANDWIAIESTHSGISKSFKVYFYGDDNWNKYIEPLRNNLRNGDSHSDMKLVWDTAWKKSNPRLDQFEKETLTQVIGTLSAHEILKRP